jgi:hypothetical protein
MRINWPLVIICTVPFALLVRFYPWIVIICQFAIIFYFGWISVLTTEKFESLEEEKKKLETSINQLISSNKECIKRLVLIEKQFGRQHKTIIQLEKKANRPINVVVAKEKIRPKVSDINPEWKRPEFAIKNPKTKPSTIDKPVEINKDVEAPQKSITQI